MRKLGRTTKATIAAGGNYSYSTPYGGNRVIHIVPGSGSGTLLVQGTGMNEDDSPRYVTMQTVTLAAGTDQIIFIVDRPTTSIKLDATGISGGSIDVYHGTEEMA